MLRWSRQPECRAGVTDVLETALWPFAVFMGLVVGLVILMMGGSYLLGERHRERTTHEPYETGMPPTGNAHVRLSSQYYLIAMFFVVFDLEAVFVLAWAVAAPDLGWVGYFEVLFFIFVLLSGLVYLWRIGALDWGTRQPRAKYMRGR